MSDQTGASGMTLPTPPQPTEPAAAGGTDSAGTSSTTGSDRPGPAAADSVRPKLIDPDPSRSNPSGSGQPNAARAAARPTAPFSAYPYVPESRNSVAAATKPPRAA